MAASRREWQMTGLLENENRQFEGWDIFFNWKSSIKLLASIQVDLVRIIANENLIYLQCGRVWCSFHFISRLFQFIRLCRWRLDTTHLAWLGIHHVQNCSANWNPRNQDLSEKRNWRGERDGKAREWQSEGRRLFPSFCDIIYELFILFLRSPTSISHRYSAA